MLKTKITITLRYNIRGFFLLGASIISFWLATLDWLDLEMEADQREYQALEVLDQIVKTAEAVRVSGLVDVHQGADLAGGEADVFVPDDDLQLLTTNTVGLRPEGIVLGHDLAVLNNSLELVHDGGVHESLLPDHGVVLVVAVIGVP